MRIKDSYSRIKNNLSGWNKNVGPLDAKIRIIFGAILISLAPLQGLGYIIIPIFSTFGAVIAGIIIIIEGLVNRCILYSILGINRCPVKTQEE